MEYARKFTAGLWVQKSLKLEENNSYISRGNSYILSGQTTGSTYYVEVDKQESIKTRESCIDHLSKVPTNRGSSEVACR